LKNLTEHFVNGLYDLAHTPLPEEVISQAKQCVLDYIGVTIAGASILQRKSSTALENINSTGELTLIGLPHKASILEAILFNGIHSHVVELDDGHRAAMMHPGAPILSALFSVAEQRKISGEDFIKGVVLGYESSIRLAKALQPSLKQKGFHGTGIAGTIGVAVAIATALHFDKKQFKDAVSAATTSASGILKVIKDVSELKPYNVGNAAQSGYTAAMLALSGFSGPIDSFEGKLGFLSMMSDNIREEYLNVENNGVWEILKIYRKPYAACRHCHSPIEAALVLKETHKIDFRQIKSIHVDTYSLAVAGHEHTEIVSVNSAKMSTPYSVAVALVSGDAGLSQFTSQSITQSDVLELAKKVMVSDNEELSALVPEKRAAIVQIKMLSGEKFSQRVDYPKGEPENNISDQELVYKFESLLAFAGNKNAKQLIEIIRNLEKDLSKIFQYL